jgi:hypothetical protein
LVSWQEKNGRHCHPRKRRFDIQKILHFCFKFSPYI